MQIPNRPCDHLKRIDLALAYLLNHHQEEIAVSWAVQIYDSASFRPGIRWLDTLKHSTRQGVAALCAILTTETYDQMRAHLLTLTELMLQDGFESSEVTGFLLLCKNAVLPVIARAYSADAATVCQLIAALDGCLSWAVQNFNTLYRTKLNQHIREQRQHTVAILRTAPRPPAQPGFNDLLQDVAERMIVALRVNHCDFYLVSEATPKLAPKVGIHRSPDHQSRTAVFESTPPDITDDLFYYDMLNQKQVMVRYDILQDPGINRELNLKMGTKSLLAVPLIVEDQVLAVAVTGTFSTYRAFTDDQIELAQNIVGAATLVIENARRYEKVRYMAVMEERERLAREIHDNLAQTLSIVNLQASHIDTLLENGETGQAQVFLAEMKTMVAEAHTDARDAIFSLRTGPKSMQEFIQMLADYLERFRRNYDVNTRLLVAPNESAMRMPAETAIQLTRIIQEALTNIRKHAAASNIRVRLEQQSNQLLIDIEDDGQGFDPAKLETTRNEQVGLRVMRERTEDLGGQMHVATASGQGTSISVCIPLATQEMSQPL